MNKKLMALAERIVISLNNLENRSSTIDKIAHGYTATQKTVVYHHLVTEQANTLDPENCSECGGPVVNGTETHSSFCGSNRGK